MKFEGSIEFSIIERADDLVVSEMPIRAGVKNPFGVIHFGAILWLADVTATVLVMGPGAQASEGMKGFPLAITLNANFFGNQTDGIFPAVSSFVKHGHTREGPTKTTFTILKCCDCTRSREWRRKL
jgi:acyl-coenzyme A thioesterase PaaI-like protein